MMLFCFQKRLFYHFMAGEFSFLPFRPLIPFALMDFASGSKDQHNELDQLKAFYKHLQAHSHLNIQLKDLKNIKLT